MQDADYSQISCISPGKETQVDPSSIFVDAVGRLWTPGVCSCNGPPELVGVSRAATPRAKKTVIPDLTAIGYALEKDEPNNQVKDDFETWDIKYSGKMDVLVDNMYVDGLLSLPRQLAHVLKLTFELESK